MKVTANMITESFLGKKFPVYYSEEAVQELFNHGAEYIDSCEGTLLSYGILLVEFNESYILIREVALNEWSSAYVVEVYAEAGDIPQEIYDELDAEE